MLQIHDRQERAMTDHDRMDDGQYDDRENIGIARPMGPTISEVIEQRLSRRGFVGGLAAVLASTALTAPSTSLAQAGGSTLTFRELPHGLDETHHVSPGYSARVLVRWGDRLTADAPEFAPNALTGAAQAKQFGYNNDFLAYMPLPLGSNNSENGLLFANHEYTNPNLMWPGIGSRGDQGSMTREQVEIDMNAHGLSVLEIRKQGGAWSVVRDSRYNRRFVTTTTEYRVAGPAAGHARLKTTADPSGTRVFGTLNNCAGGVTPWGTVLTGEENFNGYFIGDAAKTPEARNHTRYGVRVWQGNVWGNYHDRFNVEKEPNEPNRFGWVVEVDPYDPQSVPVKRTALGRIKHEGATCFVGRDGRVAVYSGDDEQFEYVYRFVTSGRYNASDRNANRNLLDEGVLSAARLNADGTLDWLPLVHGQGPLTAANGFATQADVLIETRRAADLVGATPMDRPEDVEPNPVTGRVYIACTNNTRRKAADDPNARERVNASNPRANNIAGHVVELIAPGGDGAQADHSADQFRWEMFILCGNPANDPSARYGQGTSANGWLAAPDNLAFDPKGRIWIATDGMPSNGRPGVADGLFGADTTGPGRAVTKRLVATPRGAELCGPCFTPDGRTLFVAVQHPAEERDSTFESPSTRWPDFRNDTPPRPAVLVITKDDGGEIGG
jgi:uncharacterized protein